MTLRDWEQRNKWLVAHRTTKGEISDMFAVGDRELRDSQVVGLSPDARMNHAYTAALQFASAALAAAGYRPARGGDHHFRVIQSLALTVGWPSARVETLNAFRTKRNVSSYERAGEVSDANAREMHDLAVQLRNDVRTWLRESHPNLL
jgi:hypothetical protein